MPEGKADLVADHAFDGPIEKVVAMYASEDFAYERGLAVGASECDALVDGDLGAAFTVAIRRTMATDGLQPEFRPFLGSSITVRYSEAWEPPGEGVREGTFAVDIVGVPARAAGTIRLTDKGESTELTLRGTVAVHMPFLAGLVTQAIIDSLEEAIQKELTAADSWLARG